MKVLWLINSILPDIAQSIGVAKPVTEGWLTGLVTELLKDEKIELTVCYPQSSVKKTTKGLAGKLKYYGVYVKNGKITAYDERLDKVFTNILDEQQPDIIHIMGTEYPHTLSMVNACNEKKVIHRTVISIQGLISEYAKVYLEGVPGFIVKRKTFRDFIKKDDLLKQKKKYENRGRFEVEALKKVCNVIGRTAWDKKHCMMLNPHVHYFKNNETLRREFYEGEWNVKQCEKGRLFLCQGYYPIKGLHILLQSLPKVLIQNPEVCLYISGENILGKPRWRYGSYARYIDLLIKENGLNGKVKFLGMLQPKEIRQQFLKANAFVLPSLIENSPNSLGEAMLLGVPCIAAKVGGVTSMISENEGMLYDVKDVEQLSICICRLLKDDSLCSLLSQRAKNRARITHNAKDNYQELLKIYRSLQNGIIV